MSPRHPRAACAPASLARALLIHGAIEATMKGVQSSDDRAMKCAILEGVSGAQGGSVSYRLKATALPWRYQSRSSTGIRVVWPAYEGPAGRTRQRLHTPKRTTLTFYPPEVSPMELPRISWKRAVTGSTGPSRTCAFRTIGTIPYTNNCTKNRGLAQYNGLKPLNWGAPPTAKLVGFRA